MASKQKLPFFLDFFQKIVHKIDAFLWRYGFRLVKIRFILRSLFLFNIFFGIIALCSLPLSLNPLSFFFASLLSSLNFFEMAKTIVRYFPLGGTAKVSLRVIATFFLRLALLVGLSLIAILILRLAPFAWLLGLGVPILFLPLTLLLKD